VSTVAVDATNPDPERDIEPAPPVGGPRDVPRDWRSLLVRSRPGQVVAAVAVAMAAIAIIFPNLEPSAFRDRFDWLWERTNEVGFSQNWGVFAPNPRGTSFEVVASIELTDGSVVVWKVPDHDPILGAYRAYRWQKWQERFRKDTSERLWEPVADWLARRYDDAEGGPVVRVSFTRRWMDHTPLGDGPFSADTWQEFCFYGCEDE
jgi:hypothetical protein